MNTLIISGGNIDRDFALNVLKEKFDNIIGVDGGLAFCREQNVALTHIVGDFDSLSPTILKWYQEHVSVPIRQLSPIKDATDTQVAVELAMELGSRRITILGGTGTRLDHVLGNIQTLYLPFQKGVDCQLLDSHNRIRLVEKEYSLKREDQYGKYFSLIPLTTQVTGVTITGAKYPLHEYTFSVLGTGSLGVSNEIAADQMTVTVREGILIFIESRD